MSYYTSDLKDFDDNTRSVSASADYPAMYTDVEKNSIRDRTSYLFRSRQSSPLRTALIAFAALICGYLLHSAADKSPHYLKRLAPTNSNLTIYSPSVTPNTTAFWAPPEAPLVRPPGLKIVGLIFYGRPMFVNILDCYLQKNLAVNGGYLDEVHFVVNTKHEEDLNWLDGLVARVPEYSRINIKADATHGDWTKLWDHAKEVDPDTILVKIDDDIVSLPFSFSLPSVPRSLLTTYRFL